MCRCCFKHDSDSELSSEELMLLFSTWARNQAENTVDLVYSCYITQPDGHLLVSMLIP